MSTPPQERPLKERSLSVGIESSDTPASLIPDLTHHEASTTRVSVEFSEEPTQGDTEDHDFTWAPLAVQAPDHAPPPFSDPTSLSLQLAEPESGTDLLYRDQISDNTPAALESSTPRYLIDLNNWTTTRGDNSFDELKKLFVIGRRIKKDIFDDHGHIIAHQDEVATEEIYEAIQLKGRLLELLVNLDLTLDAK